MKTYKINLATKIFSIIFIFGFVMLILCGVYIDSDPVSLFMKITTLFAFLICIIGIYAFFATKIVIDDEKIEHMAMFGPNSLRRTLFWSEIKEVDSVYFFLPEMVGWITLIPHKSSRKKPIGVLWSMISVDIVKDILFHLPPNTKVYLYPYLKRRIEGKQTLFYTK